MANIRTIVPMNLFEIGKLIQERRSSLQIKQEDLAELAGITAKSVYMLESGKGNPSYSTLAQILAVLGLDITVHIKKIIE